MCYPIFPFKNGRFYSSYPIPAPPLTIACVKQKVERTCLLIYLTVRPLISKRDVAHRSKILDFELDAVTVGDLGVISLGSKCVPRMGIRIHTFIWMVIGAEYGR